MELANGYKTKTTFWQDFSIAERYGEGAVDETYERCFEWKNDIIYMTELAIVLNLKIWQHYASNRELAELYDNLWRNVDGYIMENFDDEDIRYYLRVTD